MKRILLFQNPGTLSLRSGQIVFEHREMEPVWVPVEDIELVMVESQQVSFTEPLLVHLADNNVPLVCCDASHCPSSISYPLKGHCNQGEIVRKQLSADRSVKEALWKEIVKCKIRSQKAFLEEQDLPLGNMDTYLRLLDETESIDSVVSFEGAAARYYFDNLFGKYFRRGRYGKSPNDFLNYGYVVLRSVVVRELISAGLFLGDGLYHSNRSNEFPLADDVIEPYRVFVDRIVHELFLEGETELGSATRQRLLKVLTSECRVKGFCHALSDAVGMTARSVRGILTGEASIKDLVYPDSR